MLWLEASTQKHTTKQTLRHWWQSALAQSLFTKTEKGAQQIAEPLNV